MRYRKRYGGVREQLTGPPQGLTIMVPVPPGPGPGMLFILFTYTRLKIDSKHTEAQTERCDIRHTSVCAADSRVSQRMLSLACAVRARSATEGQTFLALVAGHSFV